MNLDSFTFGTGKLTPDLTIGEVKKDHYVHTLYVLTNEKGEWMDNFKERLQRNNDWRIVTSSDLVHASSQEKDVAMATDMDLARRSAIFLGNGVRYSTLCASLSSNLAFLPSGVHSPVISSTAGLSRRKYR
jgi:hypothetical protein